MVIIGRSPDANGFRTIRGRPSLRARVSSGGRPCLHWEKLLATSLLSGRSGVVSRVPPGMVSRTGLPFAGTMGAPLTGPGRGLGWGMPVLPDFS